MTDRFPNESVAGWEPPLDDDGKPEYDAWYDLSTAERWERALVGLRSRAHPPRWSPEELDKSTPFGHGRTFLDLIPSTSKESSL